VRTDAPDGTKSAWVAGKAPLESYSSFPVTKNNKTTDNKTTNLKTHCRLLEWNESGHEIAATNVRFRRLNQTYTINDVFARRCSACFEVCFSPCFLLPAYLTNSVVELLKIA